MTRDEAIKNLEEIIEEGWLISDLDKCTAIDACEMAIKALEQEPILDKIRAEITKLQTYKIFKGEDAVYVEYNDVLAIIDRYKESEDEK